MGRSGTADGAAPQPTRAMPGVDPAGRGAYRSGCWRWGRWSCCNCAGMPGTRPNRPPTTWRWRWNATSPVNMAVYDLSLQGAIGALQLPGLDDGQPPKSAAPPSSTARPVRTDLGSLLVLDLRRRRPGGLRLRHPACDQLRGPGLLQGPPGPLGRRPVRQPALPQPGSGTGKPGIAISRRVAGPSEWFDGVAVGELRLSLLPQPVRPAAAGQQRLRGAVPGRWPHGRAQPVPRLRFRPRHQPVDRLPVDRRRPVRTLHDRRLGGWGGAPV